MVSKEVAKATAERHLFGLLRREIAAVDGAGTAINVYGLPQAVSDCWVVYVPQPRPPRRSSVVILVSKESGEVIYYGGANDEG